MRNYLSNEIKKESNAINLETKKTNLSKEAFIQEIKNGLGEQIKLNPNKVEFLKPIEEEVIKPKKIGFFKSFFKKIMNI